MMKRRESLKTLALLSLGSSIMLPACTPKNEIWQEGMTSIAMNSTSAQFIEALSNVILPKGDFQGSYPESFSEFVATIVNDLKSEEDIIKFGQGFNEYVEYLNTTFQKDVDELNEEETATLFASIEDEESMTENAKAFYNDLRGLSIWHLKSTPEYTETYTDYEMVPGRFDGCYSIS